MTTTKKLTKKDYFATIRTHIESLGDVKIGNLPADDVLAFIDHEIDLLNNRNNGDRKPTAKQTENEAIKQEILDGMTENRLYTITEMMKEIPACGELTNQKISALLKQMVEAENPAVKKIVDKRKTYFQLV